MVLERIDKGGLIQKGFERMLSQGLKQGLEQGLGPGQGLGSGLASGLGLGLGLGPSQTWETKSTRGSDDENDDDEVSCLSLVDQCCEEEVTV